MYNLIRLNGKVTVYEGPSERVGEIHANTSERLVLDHRGNTEWIRIRIQVVKMIFFLIIL